MKFLIRPQKVSFTKDGLTELKEEKLRLEEKRPQAVTNLQKAREMGDLSENGAYKAARFELNSLDSRLRHLDRLIRTAVVITPTSDVVGIDTKVTVNDGTNEQMFHIVGGYESDPLKGKISTYSPIGKALMGRKAGETVAVITPRGNLQYKILSISV